MDTVDLETYMITATYSDATQYSDDVYPYENGCTKRSVVSLPNKFEWNTNLRQVY